MEVWIRAAKRAVQLNPRLLGISFVFFLSMFFFLFQGGKLAAMVFIIMLVLSAYLALGRWSGIAKTKGERALSAGENDKAAVAGSSVAVRVGIQVPGFWPIPYVLIKDRLLRKGGAELTFETSVIPDWARRGAVEYRTPPLRRGFYTFGGTECVTEDIFGIFEHKGIISMPYGFSIVPRTVMLKEWSLFQKMVKGMHHHSSSTRSHRETTQINGVREYNYGDRLSRIHWNATAKTGTFKSKEFERESLPKTMIVLDRQRKQYGSEEQFELAVSVVASLFEYGSKRDAAIGLLSVGADSKLFEPRSNPAHHKIMQNHLIEVEADGNHSLLHVLNDRARQFAPGMFVVVVSPARTEQLTQALGWIENRQMNGCHMWVCGAGAANGSHHAAGAYAYPIASLDDLPIMLGGRLG